MSKWETINDQDNSFVQRLKIDGGWIYHLVVKHTDYAQTFFVPEPEKCSYHNEYLVKCCYTCQRAKPYNFDSDKILEINILDLGLLTRTSHCLMNEGIKTVGDVIKRTRWDLKKVTNFGRKSLTELEQALEKLGLKLEEGQV
jgi:DNA-directed RNA polymerase alpha subunit